MQCLQCQHEAPAAAQFCPECGARLAAACSRCGRPNAPTHKFCEHCGERLASAGAVPTPGAPGFASPWSYTPPHLAEKILTSRTALEGERKQVTVLFADLKASMELLADRDPEEAGKLLDAVLERMMEAVHRYEGTVNQIMGDGIMAIFGAPLAHEDHAVRACYAALRMQEAMRRYTEEVRRALGIEVQIRVGLHSGEVVVRAISSDLHMDYSAIGQTTHLAARMEQLAVPGTIRLTGETLRLAEGFVRVTSLGPVPVKGLSAPVEVFELIGAAPTRTRLQAAAARGLTRFVGRGPELEQLRRALQQAGEGRGQIVAVVGEPGVGKSRLFYEFTRSHHAHGWLLLESASAPYGRAATYMPVIDLLRSYFKIQDVDDYRKIREKVTGTLLTLDPSLQPALPVFLALLDVPFDDSQWQALEPHQRRQRTLESVNRLLLLESQIRPVILVFEDLHWIDSETQALLDSLVESLPAARLLLLVNYRPEYRHGWASKAHYAQLRMDPLAPESADELLNSLLGDSVDLAPLKKLLVARTDANPFFLEESVRTLAETGMLVGERGAYGLAGPVQSIQVPAAVQAVLASRIDRLPPDDKHLLQCAAVIGNDVSYPLLHAIVELPEDELRHRLANLQAAEFIYETGLFPELEYTFKHSLTHEVAYESLLHERRRALHARIVAAIEALYPDRLNEHVERLAHHAFTGQLWHKALTYLRQAGGKAFAHSAHGAAVDWFEQALEALALLPESRDLTEAAIDLRLELRNALIPIGQFTRILEVLRQAEALALSLGDQLRLGLVYSFLTNYFQVTGDPERGIDYGQRALAIALAQEDFATEVVATSFLASAYQTLGDYPRAIDFARRSAQALHGDLAFRRFGMANLPSVYCRTALVRALAELGEFGDGVSVGVQGLRIAEAAEHPVSLTLAWFGLGYLHLRKGDLDHSIPALERAVELSRAVNRIWFRQIASALSSAYASTGHVAEALRLIEEAEEQAASIGLAGTPLGHGLRLAAHAEALLAAGRTDEAADLGLRALDFLGRTRARGHEAWTRRLLGAIAAQHDPPTADEAETHFRRALSLAQDLGMRPLQARCHLDLGTLYWRHGRPDAASPELLTAGQLFRALGMTAWAARAEEALAKETNTW